jgi:phage tail-like protein
MPSFPVTPLTIDPYGNFRFRVLFGTAVVAGVSKVSGLKATTEPVQHRDGGDLSRKALSPGLTTFEPITMERGLTQDETFEAWAMAVYDRNIGGLSHSDFRRDISIELYSQTGDKVRAWNAYRCWVSEYQAVPELDANTAGMAFEHIIIQTEGFIRDTAVK